MSDIEKGQYWDETHNPMSGCTKISPGCKHCFAERMARRLAGRFGYPEAPHHFDVTLHPDRLDEPLRRKKPTRYLVCSMGDLFHAAVPNEFIRRVVEIMAELAPDHTFLVLTKRPDRVRDWFNWFVGPFMEPDGRLADNIWLGITVESQEEMWRVEELLKIPAAKHWVSIEPMLGPIDISDYLGQLMGCDTHGLVGVSGWTTMKTCGLCMEEQGISAGSAPLLIRGASMGLDWVVLGGETGPGARPTHPDWVRKVRDDCVAAGVDFWFKGWGEWAPASQVPRGDAKDNLFLSTDGQTIPADTKPAPGAVGKHLWRFGKKAAGRLLDGREWNEIPETDV